MMTQKSIRLFLPVLGLLGLCGCAAPEGEPWPTVSFGHEIEASETARTTPYDIALAPLPALTDEEMAGANNPGAFLSALEDEYGALAQRMGDRKADYMDARAGLTGYGTTNQFHENWLTAQMELSNISQTVERIKTLRARIMLLGDPLPEGGVVLKKKAEALELENRRFVRDERAFLNLNAPEE